MQTIFESEQFSQMQLTCSLPVVCTNQNPRLGQVWGLA